MAVVRPARAGLRERGPAVYRFPAAHHKLSPGRVNFAKMFLSPGVARLNQVSRSASLEMPSITRGGPKQVSPRGEPPSAASQVDGNGFV